MAAELYLVRHGETEWNAQGRFQGRLDSPLTSRGRAQAHDIGRLLARSLAGCGTPMLQVSPLGRARETAAIVRRYIGDPEPILEPRIQEVTLGSWDGLTEIDIDEGWPGRLDGSTPHDWFFRAPDGEPYEAACGRVAAWLHDLNGLVVAVSHGLTGRIIRGAYLQASRAATLSLAVPQDTVWRLAGGLVEPLTA